MQNNETFTPGDFDSPSPEPTQNYDPWGNNYQPDPPEPDRAHFTSQYESYGVDAGDDGRSVWDGTTSIGPCAKIFRSHQPDDPFGENEDEDEHLAVTINEDLYSSDEANRLASRICDFLNAPSELRIAIAGRRMREAQKARQLDASEENFWKKVELEKEFDALLAAATPRKVEPPKKKELIEE